MADALSPLAALDGQAAATGLVAVHPAGCSGGGSRQGQREGGSAGEGKGVWGSGGAPGGEGGSAGPEEARWEEREKGGGGGRDSDRVRPGRRSKQEDVRGRRPRQKRRGARVWARHADAGTLAHAHRETDGA